MCHISVTTFAHLQQHCYPHTVLGRRECGRALLQKRDLRPTHILPSLIYTAASLLTFAGHVSANSDSAEDIAEDSDAAVDEEEDDEEVLAEEDHTQTSVCYIACAI